MICKIHKYSDSDCRYCNLETETAKVIIRLISTTDDQIEYLQTLIDMVGAVDDEDFEKEVSIQDLYLFMKSLQFHKERFLQIFSNSKNKKIYDFIRSRYKEKELI